MLKKLNRPLERQTKNEILTAILAALISYILEEVCLLNPHYRQVIILGFVDQHERIIGAATTCTSFILAAVFFWAILHSSRRSQVILSIFVIAAFFIEYSFQSTVQRFLLPADILMGTHSQTEMWLEASALYLNWVAIIPTILYLILVWKFSARPSFRKSSCGLILVFLGIAAVNAIPLFRNVAIDWGTSPIQLFSTIYRYGLVQIFPPEREKLLFKTDTKPNNNIVLIIDESVSADFLSVNGFDRLTTPYLDILATDKDLTHNWGIAAAGATCSEVSNALILTGMPVSNQDYKLAYQYPTLYQYAKSAGYTTYYIDAQTSWLWNGVSDTDSIFIDHWIVAPNLGDIQYLRDFAAADLIRDAVDTTTGNFIVLNKHGTHFPYETVYPPGEMVWSPVPTKAEDYHTYDVVLNSYSDAILYNVDTFFKHLFPDPQKLDKYTETTYYFYTSDHGQTLYRENTSSLHCGLNHLEARVPLIIFGRFTSPLDTSYLASHSNILPTILDLMNIPSTHWTHPYNLSLMKAIGADSGDRLYFRSSTNEIYNFDELERQAKTQQSP